MSSDGFSQTKDGQRANLYRSDLEDANVKKEYERGYKLLLDFFHQHM